MNDPHDESEERLAELTEEYLDKLRAGEILSVDTFAAAHPECEDELRELLPPLVRMEDLGRSTRPAARFATHYPDILGDYHLEEKIGRGGMGTVFRATQQSLGREVAVKILSPSWSADSRQSEAFANESRLIAGLRHTNIVEVYGAGQEGEWRYYVMGLVRGQGVRAGNLSRAFPGMPYLQAVAEVGKQAAEALSFAHTHGVLHRDVKPGNLLLDDEGVLHVSDFGLATVLNAGEDAPLVTQTHDGTLRYMAPERLLRGENSFAGDQYGLGLTLYELVTRRPVFKETEPGNLVRRICSEPLPPLKGAGELGAIINKSISFDPSDRYASMADMAADLQRYLDGVPVRARAAGIWRRYMMWWRRRPAVAIWSHAAAMLLVLLFVSMSVGYARVHSALRNENEQRLLAEKNAQIADVTMQRIFSGMSSQEEGGDNNFLPPTRADARLLQDLMPYYEQIAAQAESGSEKMAEACSILATIALQTGDYTTAETYYRRAADQLPSDSAGYVEAMNGLATSIYAQEPPRKPSARREETTAMLLHMLDKLEQTTDTEVQLELVRSLQLAARHSAPCSCGESADCPHTPPGRGALLTRAARLLTRLLAEDPTSLKARLRQVELLAAVRSPALRQVVSPSGKDTMDILEELLRKQPDSDELRRVYLRLALRPSHHSHQVDFARAVDFAQKLLADQPDDSEAILLFFAARDRYVAALRREGKSVEAAKESERTLGVLSLLTSRADFTQEVRERLIMLVAMRPAMPHDAQSREEELRTLLQNYDEKRIKSLHRRMMEIRREHMRMRETGARRRPARRWRMHHKPEGSGEVNEESAPPASSNPPAAQ